MCININLHQILGQPLELIQKIKDAGMKVSYEALSQLLVDATVLVVEVLFYFKFYYDNNIDVLHKWVQFDVKSR